MKPQEVVMLQLIAGLEGNRETIGAVALQIAWKLQNSILLNDVIKVLKERGIPVAVSVEEACAGE